MKELKEKHWKNKASRKINSFHSLKNDFNEME